MGERAPWAEATDIEEPKNLPTILLERNIRMAKEIHRKPTPNHRNGFGGQMTIAGAVTASGTDAVDANV
nr:MAG TPA: hypothetical protein [Caudoviricetes sp.]